MPRINEPSQLEGQVLIKDQLLLLLFSGLLLLPFLGGVRLFDWDEINFAEISREAHHRACGIIRADRYEYEVEATLNAVFRGRGGSGPAYGSIVAGGANAAILHYVTNDRPLRDGPRAVGHRGQVGLGRQRRAGSPGREQRSEQRGPRRQGGVRSPGGLGEVRWTGAVACCPQPIKVCLCEIKVLGS